MENDLGNNNIAVEIIDFEDLYRSYLHCIKNKHNTDSVKKFELNSIEYLIILKRKVEQRKYVLKPYRAFIVREPTVREILCASVPDRVINWFIMDELKPVIYKHLIYDCASCVEGRGTDFAIQRVEKFVRQVTNNYTEDAYYLQMDFSGFFMNIDRELLRDEIWYLIDNYYEGKYSETLKYLTNIIIMSDVTKNCIICCPPEFWNDLPQNKTLFGNNKGLPVGSLSSQWFCNYYSSFLDHYFKCELRCKFYSRYVDDIIILDKDKENLNLIFKNIQQFLPFLNIKLNTNKCKLYPVDHGIRYLGKMIYPYYTIIAPKNIKRIFVSIKDDEKTPETKQLGLCSRKGNFSRYKGFNLSRRIFNKLPDEIKQGLSFSSEKYIYLNKYKRG